MKTNGFKGIHLNCIYCFQARMQEMKEKEQKYQGNGDPNSHMCKVCFESPTAAILLPCRHFCCEWFVTFMHFKFPTFHALILACNSAWLPGLCLQCVNLVHLLVQSVQFVVQRFQIGFLLSLDRAIHALEMKVIQFYFARSFCS